MRRVDEEDAAFLAAVLSDPDDTATRLVYADWLEERGDLRGEFLRVLVQIDRPAAPAPAVKAPRAYDRLRELQGLLDPGWVCSVSRCRLCFDGLYREGMAVAFHPYLRF